MASQYDNEADQIIDDAKQLIKQLNKLLEKAGAPVRAKIEDIERSEDRTKPQSPPA
jgi:ElaB/YqjD/DUF883 family membrane-anchored ribosome-binding protein